MLRASDLSVSFARRGARREQRCLALDRVSLAIAPGEIVGVVGASGSGKTTLANCLVGLQPPEAGSVRWNETSLPALPPVARATIVQMIFQDPSTCLNPRLRVGAAVGEPVRVHQRLRGGALKEKVAELLVAVGLATALSERFPHELSGGERQRVSIARALALAPQVLVADEATSQLDLRTQAQLLDLFAALHHDRGLGILLISHDLGVVAHLATRIVVLERGAIVESGETEAVLTAPRHEATRGLVLAAGTVAS